MEQQIRPFFWLSFLPAIKIWTHMILYLRDGPDGYAPHSPVLLEACPEAPQFRLLWCWDPLNLRFLTPKLLHGAIGV